MGLSKKDITTLRSFKKYVDSDDIRYKEIIKNKLLESETLMYLLNNKDLEEAEASPDEYFGVNIFPYYIIHESQHEVKNFLCYETQVKEIREYDKYRKYQQIIFYILCEQGKGNGIEPNTYIARHDLIGALIIDMFNHTNLFGAKVMCVSNIPTVVDGDYACRTLIFEQLTDNNLVKTVNGIPRMVNKDKQYSSVGSE